jgi:hypothetical protein
VGLAHFAACLRYSHKSVAKCGLGRFRVVTGLEGIGAVCKPHRHHSVTGSEGETPRCLAPHILGLVGVVVLW